MDIGAIVAVVECYQAAFGAEETLSYLYRSSDGGASWEANPMPMSIRLGSELIVFDHQNALLLSEEMYRTSNGGVSWEMFKKVNWTGQFSFVDLEQGWAIARSGDELALVQTVDGGVTWAILEPRIVATPP
jgi:photosystem II stability/assembly factor-like uncharacterized protein